MPQGVTLAVLCLIATVGLAGSFLYLPALPMVAAGFGVGEPAAQATLTAFLLGSCIGFALYGPAADRFGHRRAFTVAGAIFVAASLAAAMTQGIGQLVAARLVQGAGSVAGVVTARATIRIAMPADRSIQAMAMLTAVVSLSPAVSPLIGAGVLQLADWRATFLVAAALGLAGILGGRLVLPRGVPVMAQDRPGRAQVTILRNAQFRAALMISIAANASFVVMMAATPFVFVESFGLSPAMFAGLIATILTVFAAVALVSGRVSARLGAARPISWAIAPLLLGAALLLVGAWGMPSAGLLALGLLLLIGSMGLMVPNAHILMLDPFPAFAGTAAGLAMLVTTAGGALAITLYSAVAAGSVAGFAVYIAGCGAATLGGWFMLRREGT
ncbi:MAG: MFS transporter, DHA1 family, bicyclomycin/chloramphenicol resistance protein [Rhodobacteraceae bacterium HLUCCA12]|nr:MAG: MFS transporter, DHA1 family, bicyclomycin/chloramphenicol resistance protein [Rhodobacteraceae bacterium HLUCCA12]